MQKRKTTGELEERGHQSDLYVSVNLLGVWQRVRCKGARVEQGDLSGVFRIQDNSNER